MVKFPILLILCLVRLVEGQQPSCGTPQNCDFQNPSRRTCGWTIYDGLDIYHYNQSNYFVGFDGYDSIGHLESIPACSTQGLKHCLRFRYAMHQDNTLSLSVFVIRVSDISDYSRAERVWTKSGWNSPGFLWSHVNVPLTTTHNSYIFFQANRNPVNNVDTKVWIDDIQYEMTPCNMITSSAATDSRPMIPSTTAEGITSSAATDSRPMIPSTTAEVPASSTATRSKANTASNNGNLNSEASPSTNVATIVGPVVAGVVVIVIVVVLLVLFKRKQLSCGKKPKREDFQMNASQNATYNTAFATSDSASGAGILHIQQTSNNEHVDSGTPSNTSDYSNVITSSEEPFVTNTDAKYMAVKKTRHARMKNQSGSQDDMLGGSSMNTSNYYNMIRSPEEPSAAKANAKNAAKKPQQARTTNSPQTQDDVRSSTYDILKVQGELDSRRPNGGLGNAGPIMQGHYHAEEYKALDFQRRVSVQANCESDAGAVYNHLNAGTDDTYNEVDREKKAVVINNTYSHIK